MTSQTGVSGGIDGGLPELCQGDLCAKEWDAAFASNRAVAITEVQVPPDGAGHLQDEHAATAGALLRGTDTGLAAVLVLFHGWGLWRSLRRRVGGRTMRRIGTHRRANRRIRFPLA